MVVVLGGCALQPDSFGSPKPQIPAKWAAYRSGLAPPVSQNWPELFRSRELTILSRLALEGNLDLDAAAARILQADAQAVIAGSALYPQINADGNASRWRSPGTLRSLSPPFRATHANNFRFGLTVSYALDFWGRNARLAEAGKLSAAASRFDYDTVALTTLVSLSNAYFQILLAQDRLRIARGNIRTAAQTLAAIRARVAVGTNTALDVAQQQSILANQRANVPVLEQQLQQNRNTAAVLLGRAPASMRIRGGGLRCLYLPRIRPGLPSQLLLRRPDIAAAEARLKAAGANITAARSALYPAITLTGETKLASLALRNLLRPDAIGAAIAGSLAQSIFSGYNLQGQVELARSRRRELLATYHKTVINALAEVENALVAVGKSARQEALRAQAVRSARIASQITAQRLREGTIDVVTLLSTQQTLFNAEDALSLARFQRLQAIVSLFQALGGGFTMDKSLMKAESGQTENAGKMRPAGILFFLRGNAGTARPASAGDWP